MDPSAEGDGDIAARLRQREVVAELAQQALGTDDLDALVHEAAAAVATTLDVEYAAVFEVEAGGRTTAAGHATAADQAAAAAQATADRDAVIDGGALRLRHGVGWPDGVVGSATVPAGGDSSVGRPLNSAEPIVVDDRSPDDGVPDDRFPESGLLASHGVVGGIGVGIGTVEAPLGVLWAYTAERRAFARHDAAFVGDVADVLASAIENDPTRHDVGEWYGRIFDGFCALDCDWEFVHLNERAHELINPEDRDLIGANVWEAFPAAADRAFKPTCERAMDEREPVTFEEYYPEPLDAWFEVRAYPSEIGLSVYFRDVTERKERERELKRTERRFEAIFEDPNILVGLLEPDGTVLDINRTAMEYVDVDLEAVVGEPFWETPWWGEGDDVRADVREWTERAAAGEYVDFEADLRRPDGQRYALEGVFRPVTNDDGDVVSVIVSDRDVTERTERERELEESERRYRTLVEQFPNGAVTLVDEDLRYQTVGGYPPDEVDATAAEVEGTSVRDLPATLADELVPRYEAALTGESGSFELTSGGRVYDVRIVPVRDDAGEVFAALGVSQDITERREYERQLEESEQRYRTLAEYFPNGIVTLFDRDFEFTLAAGRGFDRIPLEPGDLEGNTFRDVWSEGAADVLEPAFQGALDGEERAVELEYADREWILHAVPITDDRGTVFAGMTMAQDITERNENRRKLSESERRYRTLVEHFPNGAVGLFDENLRYQVAGGAAFDRLGDSADAVVGQTLHERYPPELAERLEPKFEAALEGETSTFEMELHDRHWIAYTVPVTDDEGAIFGGVIMVQDVTEREEREQRLAELVGELEESNERLEQFAYAASHDLQEPLRMVSSYLQLIERRYEDDLDADGREFLEYAVDGADRMREMIEGLLEYSRVDTRGDPFEPVELDDVLADVRQDLRLKIEESGAEITADSLPRVEGDRGQLRQLFQNLLDNAIEYSGEAAPTVDVGARRRSTTGEEWEISVSDAGIGIDSADADRVFDVFQRLHGPAEHDGTGIGLALCERIVERHDGEIWVDSEPGEGATFSFTLPAAPDGS